MAVNKQTIDKYAPKDTHIGKKLGGGILKELVIRDVKTKSVIHYSLVYINHAIYGKDNGRVLGYDNSHGYQHQHFLGKITPFNSNFENLVMLFNKQWRNLAFQHVNNQPLQLIP